MSLKKPAAILFAALFAVLLTTAATQADQSLDSASLSATAGHRLSITPTDEILVAAADSVIAEGVYSVRGTNPNGTKYKGTCMITALGGNAYKFEWSVGNSFVGTGEVDGDTISVDWGDTNPVIYTINSDGSLSGTWANGRASESLKPTS